MTLDELLLHIYKLRGVKVQDFSHKGIIVLRPCLPLSEGERTIALNKDVYSTWNFIFGVLEQMYVL